MKYDAIIVGGSFAGLAVASRLRGRILLIDRQEIGSRQTSACGTLYSVLERLDCLDSLLQVHHEAILHTVTRTFQYELPYPFCTFDYEKFCKLMLEKTEAEVIKTQVRRVEGNTVLTDMGSFSSECIVDCSGWRAVLANSLRPGYVDRSKMSFGLESVVDYQAEGLHFWVNPHVIPQGAAWLFPAGIRSRIGMGSFVGQTDLKSNFTSFLEKFGLQPNSLHGGFFPWALRSPTVENIFVVGDAAGQCLPVTGEGIRTALYFGLRCGKIVQKVIEGRVSLEQALREYGKLVMDQQSHFRFLARLQHVLIRVPNSWIAALATVIHKEPFLERLMRRYRGRSISRYL